MRSNNFFIVLIFIFASTLAVAQTDAPLIICNQQYSEIPPDDSAAINQLASTIAEEATIFATRELSVDTGTVNIRARSNSEDFATEVIERMEGTPLEGIYEEARTHVRSSGLQSPRNPARLPQFSQDVYNTARNFFLKQTANKEFIKAAKDYAQKYGGIGSSQTHDAS